MVLGPEDGARAIRSCRGACVYEYSSVENGIRENDHAVIRSRVSTHSMSLGDLLQELWSLSSFSGPDGLVHLGVTTAVDSIRGGQRWGFCEDSDEDSGTLHLTRSLLPFSSTSQEDPELPESFSSRLRSPWGLSSSSCPAYAVVVLNNSERVPRRRLRGPPPANMSDAAF
ncbi:hypothetical protein OH76DRAFT_1082211 [Lentinus brumalis]|uniref:Uncharacterized protein n=1 Tax=Lentinus brumalis TaxID=2498619 RepID=A0A371DP31_9APHY|nr:hypothetical protein OH76DRAFT_1082211 [Polyporus brumalis]